MRLVLATIVSACSIAVLIDTPRRELEEELRQHWQEYRQHTGEIPAFTATSKNLPKFFPDYTGHKREKKRYFRHAERKGREARQQKQGAEQWQRSKASSKLLATAATKTA